MPDAVIFDFDSTLTDYHATDSKAISAVVALLPEQVNGSAFLERSGEIIRDFYNSGLRLGSEIHQRRLEQTVAEFGFDWQNEYLDTYLAIYLNETRLYADVLETLQNLQGKTRLGMLTNSTDICEQQTRIRNSGIAGYFDSICIAAEIGCFKPDKKSFLTVLEQLGARAENSIFIGDSEEYDILGAKNAGMLAIKKDNGQLRPTAADYRFSCYSELKSLLVNMGI